VGTVLPRFHSRGALPQTEGRVQVSRLVPRLAHAPVQVPSHLWSRPTPHADGESRLRDPSPWGVARVPQAGLVARSWPPDGFPDAPCPDRLTVKGRGRPSVARAAAPPERSDPLTVRPDRVGGGRASRDGPSEARSRFEGAERPRQRAKRVTSLAAVGGSASTPC